MVSYKMNLAIQFVLLFIYIVQFITDLILLADNNIVDDFYNIKTYVIINCVFDIVVFLYIISKIMDYTNKIHIYNYDKESISVKDYWLFVIGTLIYFLGIGYFYSPVYNTSESRRICMNNQIFRIYLFVHLPIAVIYFTITVLFFTLLTLFFLFMSFKYCCIDSFHNRIEPY
jgi:hypothetical protein